MSPTRLKSYICNRVMDTVSHIPSTHWRYVPTNCNPADIASRGASPRDLILFELWWNGPTGLLQPPSEWLNRTDWRTTSKEYHHGVCILLTIVGHQMLSRFAQHSSHLASYGALRPDFSSSVKDAPSRLSMTHLSLWAKSHRRVSFFIFGHTGTRKDSSVLVVIWRNLL